MTDLLAEAATRLAPFLAGLTLRDALPWITAGASVLTLLAVLFRPSPARALRRDLAELDHGLRREMAAGTREGLSAALDHVLKGNAAMQNVLGAFRVQVSETLEQFGRQQAMQIEAMGRLSRDDQERLRAQVAGRLEEIRAAVDEKLQSALEQQVGESFRRVTAQFAEVQKAIGQVQSVAVQVGDLKRLFSNVKTRGGWGEAQVEAMLQDCLPEGGFARNLHLREASAEAVEFALRVPVKGGPDVWVPIDAKFPTEDYDRLLLAADDGDREAEAAARRALEQRIRLEGRRIGGKYIVPPKTVEFAVMYVPTDGLFAEIARTPGLIEQVRRDCRVMIMGPSLLPAFLHTVRVGHLTMTLERKAAEIGDTLRAVRSEWDRLGAALDSLSDRAEKLSRGIEETRVRTRVVGRRLRGFDALDAARADAVLGLDAATLADDKP